MRHPRSIKLLLALGALLAVPAAAQQPASSVHWQHDVESAKVLAKQSGRLVLVHFWTPECVPCVQLERNVFCQPGVAGAIESQFVPVKLDANQNSGLAQGFGITRVPTDVILTPEGQIVGKLISPPTPSAYIAELNQVATQFATRQGGAYDNAVATAPQPALLNDAYANLQVNAATPPAAITMPAGSMPSNANELQPVPVAVGVGTNRFPAPAPAMTAGVPPASPPAVGYAAQTPPVDRYQTQFAQSEPITPNYGSGGGAISNPNVVTPAPATTSRPAQPAPAMVPNQYAAPLSAATTPATVPQPIQSSNPYSNPSIQPQGAAPVLPGMPNQTPPAMPFAASPPPLAGESLGSAAASAAVSTPLGTASQSQAPAANAAPSPEQLPIGFDGFCAVTMRNEWKWVAGNKQWGVNHRGRLYLFVDQKEQQQFLQNPDYYAPALSGIDAVLAIEHRQTVPGLRKHSVDYDNQIYLFASEATLQQFTANPERYAASVRQAMGIERGQLVR